MGENFLNLKKVYCMFGKKKERREEGREEKRVDRNLRMLLSFFYLPPKNKSSNHG